MPSCRWKIRLVSTHIIWLVFISPSHEQLHIMEIQATSKHITDTFNSSTTHLGAVTRSKVKVTSGALFPSPPRPRRTTVSPLRTDLILAEPRLGRMGGRVAVGTDIVVFFGLLWMIFYERVCNGGCCDDWSASLLCFGTRRPTLDLLPAIFRVNFAVVKVQAVCLIQLNVEGACLQKWRQRAPFLLPPLSSHLSSERYSLPW